MTFTHGIPATILRGVYHSPNADGLSTLYEHVVVVDERLEGHPNLRPVRDNAPAVIAIHTGRDYYAVRPLAAPEPGRTSYMESGAFVVCGGGSLYEKEWKMLFRTPSHLPVPLHDRSDSWAHYNATFG
jgi:hypothetical protein